MTMNVQDRLERLSDEAPRQLGAPADIWRRGRRRQVRQWFAGAGALVVIAVLGGAVLGPVLTPQPVEVASGPDAVLRLPDVIREPGAHEPAFEQQPGPLAAVGLGTRGGLWSSEPAWWGVSATTGESRFLDLPDAVVGPDDNPVLSADGRRLAYWYAGPTTDEPRIREGADPAVGVAVIDLVSGEVRRVDTGSPHGLMTEGLAWSGDVVWWAAGQYTMGGSDGDPGVETAARVVVHTWDPAADERVVQKDVGVSLSAAGSAPDGALLSARGKALRVLKGDEVVGRLTPDRHLYLQPSSGPALSGTGVLAGVLQWDPGVVDDEPMPLMVGVAGGPGDGVGDVRLQEVAGARALAVLGWRTPSAVVVLDAGEGWARAEVVDLDAGGTDPLVELSGTVPETFATDVWTADVIGAPEPPFAPDPRLAGLALAVGVLLVFRLWLAVRRRRDRP